MIHRVRSLLLYSCVGAALALLQPAVHADLILTLSETGFATQTYHDSSNASVSTGGSIVYGDYVVSASALGDALLGTPSDKQIFQQDTSVTTTKVPAHALVISVTQTAVGFTPPSLGETGTLSSSLSGSLSGTPANINGHGYTLGTYLNATNEITQAFTVPAGNLLPSVTDPLDTVLKPVAVPGASFSLSQVATFTISKGTTAGLTSDAQYTVPEPSTLAIFGLGLPLFGFYARRRRARALLG